MRRIATIGVLLATLAALTYYGYRAYPELRLTSCFQEPLRYDGAQVTVGTETTVEALSPDGFIIHHMGRSVRVLGDPGRARVGDFVRLQATFHKEGYLTLQRLYVARKRRAKIAVSTLPVLLVVILLVRTYRFDRARRCLVERRCA